MNIERKQTLIIKSLLKQHTYTHTHIPTLLHSYMKMNDFPSELFLQFFFVRHFLLVCFLLLAFVRQVSFSSETVSTHEYQQLYSFFV